MANTATDRALAMARRALGILELQAAGYGALHIPVHLQIELEEKRREVAELEARLNAPDVGSSVSTVFDQRGQTVGTQTNIAGNVDGPVLSGKFEGPVAVGGGEAVNLRGSQGAVYKPTGPVKQHFGDNIRITGDGNVVGDNNMVSVSKSQTTDASLIRSLRMRLQQLDVVEIESLCLDHFPIVYDRFSRGLRRDEMINVLLDYCRRNPDAAQRLSRLLPEATNTQ